VCLLKQTAKFQTTRRLVIFLALVAFFVAPKIVFGQIIINEIMYDLAGTDDKHEWVELFNNGSLPVDLTDYKINDGDTATNHSLNAPPKNNSRGLMVLGASEYLLLAGDANTLIADLPNYNETIIDTIINLSNTNSTLKLLDKDGLEVSIISYNKDLGAAGNGRTLEWDGTILKESTVDRGTPGQANSVLISTGEPLSATPSDSPATTSAVLPPPTLTTPTPYQYSKDILINEFLPNPPAGEKEWVELFNAGESAVNLFGWQIDDDDNSTAPQIIPENTTIKPGEFLVISFNKSTLNNDGDKVRLLWPDDQVVHTVSYSKSTQGQSVAKFSGGWLWTNQSTPGQANKKSIVERNSSLAIIAAVSAAEKISPIEEGVIESTDTSPNKKTPNPQTNISPTPIFSTAKQPNNSPENINLSASINEPVKDNIRISSFLSLVGVILLAGLSAGALIYFRKQRQIDTEGMDD